VAREKKSRLGLTILLLLIFLCCCCILTLLLFYFVLGDPMMEAFCRQVPDFCRQAPALHPYLP